MILQSRREQKLSQRIGSQAAQPLQGRAAGLSTITSLGIGHIPHIAAAWSAQVSGIGCCLAGVRTRDRQGIAWILNGVVRRCSKLPNQAVSAAIGHGMKDSGTVGGFDGGRHWCYRNRRVEVQHTPAWINTVAGNFSAAVSSHYA